jgi:hypothetical protein
VKIFIVNLAGGKNHSEQVQFVENLKRLNAKGPDFSDINDVALLSSNHDIEALQNLVFENITSTSDITVEEITASSLKNNPTHRVHADLVKRFFHFVDLG